jgi:hypothetical protein
MAAVFRRAIGTGFMMGSALYGAHHSIDRKTRGQLPDRLFGGDSGKPRKP